MNYDRVAQFLSTATTPGFRRSLNANTQATLLKCGFDPVEASRVWEALNRLRQKPTDSWNRVTSTGQNTGGGAPGSDSWNRVTNTGGNTGPNDDWNLQ